MAYCLITDVQRITGLTFTLTSRPTIEQADAVIDDIAADLDGVLQAAGYTVPVTATQALGTLKRYNELGASCDCWHGAYQSQDAPARVARWCGQYDEFLKRIRMGQQQLPGLDPESDLDPAFDIVPQPPRDGYLTSGESLEE